MMRVAAEKRIKRIQFFIKVPDEITTEQDFYAYVDHVKRLGNPVISADWTKREILSHQEINHG